MANIGQRTAAAAAMEAQPPSGSSSSSAAYPRWVMLEEYLEINVEGSSSCPPTDDDDDDDKTLAAALTSNCHPIQVSLRLSEPPAPSRVCLRIPDGLSEEKSKVLAAHGDSVLILVRIKETNQQHYTAEHFVYNAGDRAAEPPRPPSLWLLPPLYAQPHLSLPGSELVPQELVDGATGLLRRGEDELVVAELRALWFGEHTPWVGELCMFRSGEWKQYQFVIRDDWGLPWLSLNTVVPVDDRLLCWVDLCHGAMLIDVFDETPMAQYLRFPMDPRDGGGRLNLNRNVCATAGGGTGTLKFVDVFGRCCCGAAAACCDCKHARHAYTIQTWTMRVGNGGDMEWVKDGMVDSTELWALDAYNGLPCDPLDRPVVSLDEPELICFRLRDSKRGSRTVWQMMLNMRSKTMHSVSRHKEELGHGYTRDKLIASNVSCFFNNYTSSGSGDYATLTGQRKVDSDMERPLAVVVDSGDLTLQSSALADDPDSVQAALAEMSEALREIPSYGLLGPDEVKAYRILICSDNGRRMRSLLRLPKDLRKDWLLMEMKTWNAN